MNHRTPKALKEATHTTADRLTSNVEPRKSKRKASKMALTSGVSKKHDETKQRPTQREQDDLDMFVGLKTFKGNQRGWNGQPEPLR